MQIDKELEAEIREFCKENGLKPTKYVNDLLKKAFTADKFGSSPFEYSMPIYRDPVSGMNIIGKPDETVPEEQNEGFSQIETSDFICSDDIYGENKIETRPKKRILK